jgi:[ribosomal protein S18]-alanine N-acetyltransferase
MPSSRRRASVRLRPMSRTDLDAVLAIEVRAFTQPWSRQFFEKELVAPQAGCTVAVDAEVLVGYSVRWRIADEVHLLNVAVHPAERGLGVGRRLVEAVLAEGRATGARVAYLEVRAGNVAARRLYRDLGFQDLGVRRGYYGVGQDAIVMELGLRSAP